MAIPTARALVSSQVAIESFQLSPDGEWVVYAARTVQRGAYRSHLWVVPWQGGRARQLTRGNVRDSAPTVGMGGLVAFARTPGEEPHPGAAADPAEREPQIWVVPLAGGEAWQLTHLPHGAGTPSWSPDGRHVAFLAQAGPHRFAVGAEAKGRAVTARRLTRLDYRDDESGHLSRRTHLWVVAARNRARPAQLTHGDFDVAHPAWAPDGTWLAFDADMGPDANIAPRSTVHRVAASGGPVSPLAELRGDAHRPAISPDGRWVAFLGTDRADPPEYELTRLWVAPVEGGRPRCLTKGIDRSIGCDAWADLVQAEDRQGPAWASATELLVIITSEGRNLPYRVSLGGELRPLLAGGRVVGAGVTTAAGRIALSAGVDRHAAEVYALEGAGQRAPARLRAITTDGSAWQRRFPLPRWDELTLETANGPMQAWLASPPGAGSKPLPTIVQLHGGPDGSWGPGGTMDATHLCGRGYRVVMPNHRGSSGFGLAWSALLPGHWGGPDARDVLATLDLLVARGLADPDRLGVMGVSYGGFLTQWLIGTSNRFRAAVGENGVANQVSAWGNSYFGVHYNRRWKLGNPLTRAGMLRLWASSPLANVGRMRTPLLLLQSEEDRICPASDAEQLFHALKVLGRETEFILYPEEHHGLKIEGRPDRRIDRMERILAWFDRWVREMPG